MNRLIKIPCKCGSWTGKTKICQFYSYKQYEAQPKFCILYSRTIVCDVFKRKPRWCKAEIVRIFDRGTI